MLPLLSPLYSLEDVFFIFGILFICLVIGTPTSVMLQLVNIFHTFIIISFIEYFPVRVLSLVLLQYKLIQCNTSLFFSSSRVRDVLLCVNLKQPMDDPEL